MTQKQENWVASTRQVRTLIAEGSAGGELVAVVYGDTIWTEKKRAIQRARLVAMAPRMLRALREVANYNSESGPELETIIANAEAIIAELEGTT